MRRRMMQSGGGGRLPREYQEVEYLESLPDGRTYLLLDAINKTPKQISTKFSYSDDRDGFWLGGNFYGGNRYPFIWGYKQSSERNGTYVGIGNSDIKLDANSLRPNTLHNVIVNISNNSFDIYINDVSKGRYNWSGTLNINSKTSLFGYYTNRINPTYQTATVSLSSIKIYYYHIINTDNTEVNLIPCYRKTDLMPGMYDIANSKFYTNANQYTTDIFIVGPDVN